LNFFGRFPQYLFTGDIQKTFQQDKIAKPTMSLAPGSRARPFCGSKYRRALLSKKQNNTVSQKISLRKGYFFPASPKQSGNADFKPCLLRIFKKY